MGLCCREHVSYVLTAGALLRACMPANSMQSLMALCTAIKYMISLMNDDMGMAFWGKVMHRAVQVHSPLTALPPLQSLQHSHGLSAGQLCPAAKSKSAQRAGKH